MRHNAKEVKWLMTEIKGVIGYFCDLRINIDTVPPDFKFWEVADDDSNGEPSLYAKSIFMNFYGTFITKGSLPIDNKGRTEGYINNGDFSVKDDYRLLGGTN